MSFSQSLQFGDSTYLKLESEVNHAISDKNPKDYENLEVILESPTNKPLKKSSASSFTRSSRVLSIANKTHRAENSTKDLTFRRSKSDSRLLKTNVLSNTNASDNYEKFFESDFSFHHDSNNDEQKEIRLRVSPVETSLKDASNIAKEELDNGLDNSLERPIFSEDIKNMLNTEAEHSSSEDSLPSSSFQKCEENYNEPTEILHDMSSFICLPNDNTIFREQLFKKELDVSRRIFKELQPSQDNASGCNISLSCLSPEQLKCTQGDSSAFNVKINHQILRTCEKSKRSSQFEAEKSTEILLRNSEVKATQLPYDNLEGLKSIKAWNLPLNILKGYERKGIRKMFDWQVECLSNPKVLFDHCNLVYSAPTSAGKTLVSEILLLKTVLERNKKVLLILPFVSVVREKMLYLQDLLTAAGYRVEGFFGGYTPAGGFDSINVAVCTIEKANSIINKLLEQGKLNEIGTVIVDEIHLISDQGRGYILELLLAKTLYMSRKYGLKIQIITMSATLGNVELLRKWLNAELYVTDFRPVALQEMIKIGNVIYDNSLNVLRSVTETGCVFEPFPALQNDPDNVAQLCIETLVHGCSVIVFCPSKDWCENLATQLAGAIHFLGKQGGEWGTKLKAQINRQAIENVKQQLRDIPTGLDDVLGKCVTYGCSFHHAGLTTEEREIVETNFKCGALRIIVATSTLSSGVNLPARRVIIRSPLFGGKQMSSLTYRQMIGRAGRTGKDILGESILICTESNARAGKELLTAKLNPVCSCLDLDSSTHLKRALLEVISSGIAVTKDDIESFVNCTLLSAQNELVIQEKEKNQHITKSIEYIRGALDFLTEYEFVRLQTNEETQEQNYVATRLGNACLASSMPPMDGLLLFAELQKSRRCFVLESELHAVYLVTPYSVCYQLQDLDWLLFLDLWEKLTPAMKKVGELVGVKESFLVRAMRGQTKLDYKLMQIHKRFYTALALQELVNEVSISDVAVKYNCTRGLLQSLQQMSSTFAGIVTSFCDSLQWDTLSLIVSQFKERLCFGIHRDLIDLMRLPDLNQKRARILFDAGITSLIELAGADVLYLEKILYNALSFDSMKKHDNENEIDAAQRNEARTFFLTGKAGVTVAEAAKFFIREARKFIQYEIGVGSIKWLSQAVYDQNGRNNNDIRMSYEENKFHNNVIDNSINKNIECSENTESYLNKTAAELMKEVEENNTHDDKDTINREKRSSLNQETDGTAKYQTNTQQQYKESKENDVILEDQKRTNRNKDSENTKNLGELKAVFGSRSFRSSENLDEVSKACFSKKEKVSNNENDLNYKIGKHLGVNHPKIVDSEEQPCTSQKAQRLLKAKQLSEMKKQERDGRIDNQLMKTVNIGIPTSSEKSATIDNFKTSISKKAEKSETKNGSPEEPEQIKSSLRNCATNSTVETNKNAESAANSKFENEENVLKEAVDWKEILFAEDEIPSSQKLFEENNATKPNSPYSSRFLRSSRAIQKIESPKAKPLTEYTKLQKLLQGKDNLVEPVSIELSDFSLETSLMKHSFQLNASHIPACSGIESESSSFKSLDIIDICGDEQLFKAAFKELMLSKRLGFCLGVQQQYGKRKPVIGANLLLNQIAATEREMEQDKSYEFHIDDKNYLAGIGFCISKNVVYYMNMQQEGSCKRITGEIKYKYLRMLLHSEDHTLLVYDAKEHMKILRNIFKDIGDIRIALEDPKVANWLLQPDNSQNLHDLAKEFAPEYSSLVTLCGSSRGYNSYGLDSDSAILPTVRSAVEACVTLHILKGQQENLERIGTGQLHKVFTELEMPMQMSLCNMEHVGFPVSSEALHKLFQQMDDSLKKLENKIYERHGSRFNLSSSSAVAKVLGLHQKPREGISTSKHILEKIDSPLSQMIITYRKLSSTLTRNIQPLLKSVKEERIHGHNIYFTSTGRISMAEPSLQNVARDFEVAIGLETKIISCRSAFFPLDSKRCLISSDFCQLEMRILAHLSQDSALLHVMKSEADLFVSIAAKWNKIPENSVTHELRNRTKQICYGIVYGMGMRALAENLKCSEEEAAFVSEQFHAVYPGIRSYTENVVKFAKDNGYVKTITGRRRYVKDINSEQELRKKKAERQAVNSTVQGSAADIAKSAILRMEKNIVKYQEKLGIAPHSVHLVLQLHDELIFEVPAEKAKKIAKVLGLTMESCVKLSVPLKVKIKIGKNWGELKEFQL